MVPQALWSAGRDPRTHFTEDLGQETGPSFTAGNGTLNQKTKPTNLSVLFILYESVKMVASKATITLPRGCWASRALMARVYIHSNSLGRQGPGQWKRWAVVVFPAPLSEDFVSASLRGRGFPAVTVVRSTFSAGDA